MGTYHIFSPQNIVNRPSLAAMPQARNCRNVCQIAIDLGHTVYHYGAENSEVVCTEHVDVIREAELEAFYGDAYQHFSQKSLGHTGDPIYQLWLERTYKALRTRAREGDYLCAIWNGHREITDTVCKSEWGKAMHAMEVSIGYEAVWTRYKVFQSKAWRDFQYGIFHNRNRSQPKDVRDDENAWTTISNPYYFLKPGDTVIPNVIHCSDFTLQTQKGDYLCYVGRVIRNKGVLTAVLLAKALGVKLKIAGQGRYRDAFGEDPPAYVEEIGMVNVPARDRLMGGAIAGICMPRYIEPGINTAGEYNAAGTPVICYTIGGPSEVIVDGVTGFHVEDFSQAVDALKKIESLSPAACRAHVEKNYSLEVAGEKYDRYFKRIDAYVEFGAHGADAELNWVGDRGHPEFYTYPKVAVAQDTETLGEVGVYFEIGAGWPVGEFLTKNGWTENTRATEVLSSDVVARLSEFSRFDGYFVEAVPQQIAKLQETFSTNPNAQVIHAAVSGLSGLRKMNVHKGGMGALEETHAGTRTAQRVETESPDMRTFWTQTIDLDTLFTQLGVTPDLLRIDIEGAELTTLLAYRFAEGAPRVIIVDTHTVNREAVAQLLETKGYTVSDHPTVKEDLIGVKD